MCITQADKKPNLLVKFSASVLRLVVAFLIVSIVRRGWISYCCSFTAVSLQVLHS